MKQDVKLNLFIGFSPQKKSPPIAKKSLKVGDDFF